MGEDSLATRWHVPNREWVGWESRNQKSRLDRGRDEAKICQEKPWDEMEAAWKVVRESGTKERKKKGVCGRGNGNEVWEARRFGGAWVSIIRQLGKQRSAGGSRSSR